jgi:tRNA A37 threonylcarbamoyladenosine synthetase subunit TsaC/SUA5/YrdC
MTVLRAVTMRDRDDMRTALADGRVIVWPGADGYGLAARLDRPAARDAFDQLVPTACGGHPPVTVVATIAQAMVLSEPWNRQAEQLVDRLWPGPVELIVQARDATPVRFGMPKDKTLRALCHDCGPLLMCCLRGQGGESIFTSAEALRHLAGTDVALLVEGGTRHGPPPTVVDCTVSPPVVTAVGAVPAAFVEASLLMAARRRIRWLGM